MLNPNVIITVPLRSRSPSASSSRSGRTQKWKRQLDGDSVTRFVGKGILLVLTVVISGNVCHSAVGTLPTPARAPAPTTFPRREAWPKAASNPADEAAAAAAATEVPRRSETASPAGKGLDFVTSSKVGDSAHPSLRATHGHVPEGRAAHEGGLVESGLRYSDASERHGVDLEDQHDREVQGYVVAVPSEGPERKRLRSMNPSSSVTGGERGPQVWRVPFQTSKDAGREEEEVRQEEGRRRAGEERVKEESKGKKLDVEKTTTHKEDERVEKGKMKEEHEDVRAQGKQAEHGGKQDHTGVSSKEFGRGVRGGEHGEGKRIGEHAGTVEESGKKKEGGDVTAEGKTEADTKAVKKAEDKKEEENQGLVRTQWLLDKARQILERPLLSEHMMPFYFDHPLCITGSSRWCGGESKRNEGTPFYTLRDMMRPLDALVWSIFKIPPFDISFPFPSFPSAERAAPVHVSGACRYVFTIDLLPPLDDIRLYVAPSERQVGLTADRKVKRSEEGKAYSQVYGTETRLHAVASIAEGCMVSEKLVKAGLIGWSYAGKTDGNMDILVAFPSEAHAKKLVERKELTEDAYKCLIEEEGLEHLKPSEKCALSGRTQSECDHLKAEAGAKHEAALTVSTEGYADNQIRLPEFVYA